MNYITISKPSFEKVTFGRNEGIEKLETERYLMDSAYT